MEERKTRVTVSFDITLEENYELLKKVFALDKNFKLNQEEALFWAVENNNIELVRLLIQAGADVTADDNRAIQLATMNKHIEIIKLLTKETIRCSTTKSNYEIMKMLISDDQNSKE